MTNGDKIRSMTDEELSSFIFEIRMNYGCPEGWFFKEAVCMDMSCQECWEDWLKQEVDDGNKHTM